MTKTEFKDFEVPASATHLLTLDSMRGLVASVDLSAEAPKSVYVPKGDSLYWFSLEDADRKYIASPSLDNDMSVELTYQVAEGGATRPMTYAHEARCNTDHVATADPCPPAKEDKRTDVQKALGVYPIPNPILRFFEYEHLSNAGLRALSQEFHGMAYELDAKVPDGPEKSAGLRKLLEAKDCFVRAAL